MAIGPCFATPSSYQIDQVSLLQVSRLFVGEVASTAYGARNVTKPIYCMLGLAQ